MNDPKRFVAFVLEASGRLGPEASAFLEYLKKTPCPFPILRFRASSPLNIMRRWHSAGCATSGTRFSI